MRAILGVLIMAGLLGTMEGGKAQQLQQPSEKQGAMGVRPPDFSKLPKEFSDEAKRYRALWEEKKIDDARYGEWANLFMSRIHDYVKNQNMMLAPVPDEPPKSELVR